MPNKDSYLQQQDAIETFFAFHPEAFEDIPPDEMDILANYYFVNRDIDVSDVFDHASNLAKENPETEIIALRVARKIFNKVGLDENRIKELLEDK